MTLTSKTIIKQVQKNEVAITTEIQKTLKDWKIKVSFQERAGLPGVASLGL